MAKAAQGMSPPPPEGTKQGMLGGPWQGYSGIFLVPKGAWTRCLLGVCSSGSGVSLVLFGIVLHSVSQTFYPETEVYFQQGLEIPTSNFPK